MNRISWLILFLLAFKNGVTQTNVFEYPLESSKRERVLAYVAESYSRENIAVTFLNKKKVVILLLDKNFKEINQVILDRKTLPSTLSEEDAPLAEASCLIGNKIQTLYKVIGRKEDHYVMETFSFDSKAITRGKPFFIPKDEKLARILQDNARNVLLCVNDKSNELIFYTSDENGDFIRKSIILDLSELSDKKFKTLSWFIKGTVVMPVNNTSGLDLTAVENKLYIDNDDYKFTFLAPNHAIKLITIDKNTLEQNKKTISLNGLCETEGSKQSNYNATFFDNKIFTVNDCKTKIEISVFNLNGELLKKYEITEQTGSELFSANPLKIERDWSYLKETPVEDNKILIKKLFEHPISISITKDSAGNYQLAVGEHRYKEKISYTGGRTLGGMQSSPQPTGGTYSGTNIPIMREGAVYNANLYQSPSIPVYTTGQSLSYFSTKFLMALDTNLNLVKNNITKDVDDQVKDFIGEFDYLNSRNVQFFFNSQPYFTTYDSKKQAFYIQKIEIKNP